MSRPLQTVQLFGVPHPEPRRRRKIATQVPTEAAEQRMVCEWLNAHRLLYTHPANEGRRSAITGSLLRSLGMKRGVPDLLVFTPPKGRFGIVGVAIEMKRRTGGSLSTEQRDWLDALKQQGWATHCAHGADDAIAWLESLYGRSA